MSIKWFNVDQNSVFFHEILFCYYESLGEKRCFGLVLLIWVKTVFILISNWMFILNG